MVSARTGWPRASVHCDPASKAPGVKGSVLGLAGLGRQYTVTYPASQTPGVNLKGSVLGLAGLGCQYTVTYPASQAPGDWLA